MSRAVTYEAFGGPDVLDVRDVVPPNAGPDDVRVRVHAASLNPMDWGIAADPTVAARFGTTLPALFGSDFAGVVDQVGRNVVAFREGDRVFGAALGRGMADFVVVNPGKEGLGHIPDNVDDEVAATIPVAGLTAAAALSSIQVHSGDVVLIGGAAGGVGTFATQLARLAGASVIGTASLTTFEYVRSLGAVPIEYGPGLVEHLRALDGPPITAAADLFGVETARDAVTLGVAPSRIVTVAAVAEPPAGTRTSGAFDADFRMLDELIAHISGGSITVPIAARFPLAQIRDAVALHSSRHVHGKITITF